MPKKKWGQNFLRNRGAVDRIVAAVEPEPDEIVVEIGPGEGALTEKLVAIGNEFLAYEIDPELADKLRERFGQSIVTADAVTAPLPERPFRAVGNLPYNVGTAILRRVIADPLCARSVFMLQKEVADRLIAKPGDEAFGYLTLFTQLYARPRQLMTLEPHSFFPPPKVRSAVVILDRDHKPFASQRLIDVISASFRMRRKTLVNNLIGWNGLKRYDATIAIEAAGLAEGVRAEEMSLTEFERLSRHLSPSE